MNVLILTEGGRDIGFGHVARCVSLCQAFEEKGIVPEIIVNGDPTVKDLLKGKKYRTFNWLEEKDNLLNTKRAMDVIIIDSYLADAEFYDSVASSSVTGVYIDDYKRLDYPKGIVLNVNIYAEKLDYPEKEGITYLLGSRYALLRKEFWGMPKKEIKDNIESVMITFGANDTRNMAPTILKFLNDKYPDLTKNVVIGAGFRNKKAIEILKNKKTNLIYSPGAEKIKQVMLESDFAISAGGQTLYELACLGLPTIGICVAENQMLNIKGFEKEGLLSYIGWYYDEALLSNLDKGIGKLASREGRIKKSRRNRVLFDGQGASRALSYIGI